MKKQHSLEEYSLAVKKLKLMAKQMINQNNDLEYRIDVINQLLTKGPSRDKKINSAIIMSRKNQALQVYKSQKKSKVKQDDEKKSIPTEEDNNSTDSSSRKEKVLKQFKAILEKKCLTYEMLFRCCDPEYKGQVSIEDISQFITKKIVSNDIKQEDLGIIIQAFDEDCSGIVTKEEFRKCLACFNLNETPNKLTEQRINEKEAMFKVVKFLDQNSNSQRMSFVLIFDQIASNEKEVKGNAKDQANQKKSAAPPAQSMPTDQFREYFTKKGCDLKDMEAFTIFRLLDPLKTGIIEKKAFVREMNCYFKMIYEVDIDREMHSFSELLAKHKVDPVQAFRVADTQNKKTVSKEQLQKAIIKLGPLIKDKFLERFLDFIDVNKNGEIDEQEYLVALSQDEGQVLFNFSDQKNLTPDEKQEILDKFLTYLTKNSITQEELFRRIDRNLNGSISLLEMKFALLDIGFEIPQIAKIMKLFDTDSDSKIDKNEFNLIMNQAKVLPKESENDAESNRKYLDDLKSRQKKRMQEVEILKKQEEEKEREERERQQQEEEEQNQEKKSLPEIDNISEIGKGDDEGQNNVSDYSFSKEQDEQQNNDQKESDTEQQYKEDQEEQEEVQEEEEYKDDHEQEEEREEEKEEEREEPIIKNKPNLKINTSNQGKEKEEEADASKVHEKSPKSASSKKSVKFNLFEEAEIQMLILNEENIDFNMFFENLKKQPFKDQEFPCSVQSLTTDIKSFPKAKDIIWKKSKEVYKNDLKIFQNIVEPGDIKQGGLGDCYFLSSLSVLAERENLIKRLFVTKEINESQCYAIWMCIDSEWTQNILDDYLPCNKDDGEPAFSRGNGEELWVLLLEKCYAKKYGAYDKIEAGQTIEAIKDLTGAPGKSIQNEDANVVWDFLLTNERKNFILTCGSQSDDRGLETKKESGIVSSHAYGILDVQELKTQKNKVVRLVKMRNPWGSMEWKGDWSDNSKCWTPELRKQLNYFSNEDDGIFWMEINDYIKEFGESSVNYMHDNYFYSWKKFTNLSQEQCLFQFKIKADTHCYIMLSQKSERHYSKEKNKKYTYSMLKMFLFQIDPTNLQPIRYIGDNYTPFREGFIEANLSKGTYAIAFEILWTQQICKDAIISIYSENQVNFSEVGLEMNPSEGFVETLCSAVLLKDFSQSPGAKKSTYEESADVLQFYEQFGGYVFFYYENKSSNATLEEEISLTGSSIELIERPNVYSSSSQNVFTMIVPPQSNRLALYQIQGDGKGAISFSIGTSYSVQINRSIDEIINEFLQDEDRGDQRDFQGKPVEYYFKVHQYDLGFVLLFQNRTKNLIGSENIEFQNTNLKIMNTDINVSGDKVTFTVQPGKHQGIILEVDDKKQGSGIGYSDAGTQFKKV